MPLPLEVLADLQLDIEGEQIHVRGDGDRVVVELPSLRAGQLLVTKSPLAIGDRQRSTERVNEALQISGITVEVHLRGDVIARIGANARPGAVARLLKLGSVEVQTGPTLKAAARERPGLTAGLTLGLLAFLIWLFRSKKD